MAISQWQVTWGHDTGFRRPVADTACQQESSFKRGALISNDLERVTTIWVEPNGWREHGHSARLLREKLAQVEHELQGSIDRSP